jgi:hypothetical protein
MKKLFFVSILFVIASCTKTEPDKIEKYTFSGAQTATYDKYVYNQNGSLSTYFHWDTLYQDKIDVELNLTKSLIQFKTTPSFHISSPSDFNYSTRINYQYYTVNIGNRIRYEFNIINDTLYADYYNLLGLGNDTLVINKKMNFKGVRQL